MRSWQGRVGLGAEGGGWCAWDSFKNPQKHLNKKTKTWFDYFNLG